MSREMVMTLVLLALVGVAGYMYQDMVMDYAKPVVDPVMKMVGFGGGGGTDQVEPESPDLPADALLKTSLGNFLTTVQRSVNIPRRDLESYEELTGLSFNLQLTSSIPESAGVDSNWSEIDVSVSNRAYFSGGSESTIRVNQPEAFPVPELKLLKNDSTFQLLFPKTEEYFQSDVKSTLRGQDVDTSLMKVTQNVSERVVGDVEPSTWKGKETYDVKVENTADTGTTVFHITRAEPYSILGTGMNNMGQKQQTTTIQYRSDKREMLQSVTVEQENRTSFQFQYGNDQLQVIEITSSGDRQFDSMKLSFTHGDNYSSGVDITVPQPDGDEPLTLAHLEWGFTDDELSSFLADINYPMNGDQVKLSLSLEDLKWLREKGSIEMADVSGMTELSQQDLGRKITPAAMMAMSAMNQSSATGTDRGGTLPSAGEDGDARVEPPAAEEQPERPAGREVDDDAGSPKPEQTAETREQAPETSSSDRPQASQKPTRTGEEAAPNSGETIKYSSVGRFPMSEPPAEYEEARDAYHAGNFSRAQSKLKNLVETYPNSANVNYLLGVTYFEQGEFEQAKSYFQKASELDHDPQIKVWSEQYLDRIDNKMNS